MAGPSLSQLFRRYTDVGDVRALGEVFDRAAPELLAVARHLVSDEAAAEDVVQATFLAAIEHPERFDPSRDLVPWLLGILANKARVARTSGTRVPDPSRLPGERIEDPETDAQLREFMGTLEKALERVPEAYRKVLRIYLSEGKGPEEIARELDRSSGTVRVQLHRGLRHLRRKLPAGFALGGLVLVTVPRGIAAIRARILERASTLAGAGTAGATFAGYTGGILMSKKIAAAVGVVMLASGTWWAMRGEPEARVEAAVPEAPFASLAPLPDESAPVIDRSMAVSPGLGVEPTPRVVAVALTDPYGALDLECVWTDGTPAAGMGVAAQSKGESQPWNHPAFGLTDERGHLTFERLHEGTIEMQTDRGCSSQAFEASVQRGQRTSARFTVPPGEEVRGRVLDPTGRAVANAPVRITSSMEDGGAVVTRSASDGSYSVHAVNRSCDLFATADGFGSSVLGSLNGLEPNGSGALVLDLSLRGDGGTITGIVRAPEGAPIADAWVVIRCAKSVRRREMEEWPRIWATTDSAGAFRFEGVHVGPVDLFVDVEGYAAWTGQTSVEKDRTSTIEARMDKGFWVEGTVATDEGSAAAHSTINHGPSTTYPDYVWRRYQTTEADEKGAFRLGPIPSGKADLRAVRESPERILRAGTKLIGRSGDVLPWNPTLREDPKITGRVVDESGQPLVGWRVEMGCSAILDHYPPTAQTDAEGRFVLRDCADVPFLVAAYPPGDQTHQAGMAGAKMEDVLPGKGEILLKVVAASPSNSFLSGKIVDEQEKPVGDAQVVAIDTKTETSLGTTKSTADGAVRIGPIPSGTYEILIDRRDLPPFGLGPIEIASKEQRDLGVIRLKARGKFELVLHREDGALVDRPFLMLFGDRYGHPLESDDGSTFRSEEVYEGSYVLLPIGCNVASVQRTVEIRGGETTRLDLRLPAGVVRTVLFRVPQGETGPKKVHVVVRSSDGKVLFDRESSTVVAQDKSRFASFRAGFASGKYSVEAESADGWGSRVAFEVDGLTAETKPIEATLAQKP